MEALDLGYVYDSSEEDEASAPVNNDGSGGSSGSREVATGVLDGRILKRRRCTAPPPEDFNAAGSRGKEAQPRELETPPKTMPAAARSATPGASLGVTKPSCGDEPRDGCGGDDLQGLADVVAEVQSAGDLENRTLPPEEGYTLRDLRRIIAAMLQRYGQLLSAEEHQALQTFTQLPMRAQQLYARLLGRKWPQWIAVQGLGAKYRELGEEQAALAVQELVSRRPASVEGARCATPVADDGWLLDSAAETPSTLFARRVPLVDLERAARAHAGGEILNLGTVLLEALPMGQLKSFASGLGVARASRSSRETKATYLSNVCRAARSQRLLTSMSKSSEDLTNSSCGGSTLELRMLERALASARWVCVAPSAGRTALSLLVDLFHVESQGSPGSAYMVMTTKWPKYDLPAHRVADPLFKDRARLDEYLVARRMCLHFETDDVRTMPLAGFAAAAAAAEAGLRTALAILPLDPFEFRKLRSPFRRRFTAAWCWVDALHHAIMRMPGLGKEEHLRDDKVRQLELLLQSQFSARRRGRWYNELAKEVLRSRGALAALEVAAEGLAEGEPPPLSSVVEVDLVSEPASSQDGGTGGGGGVTFPTVPRDTRWELARRCQALARRADAERRRPRSGIGRGGRGRGGSTPCWRRLLRETPSAVAKARGGDDGGRWLPCLVERLVAEEAAAIGPVRTIAAASVGMPMDRTPKPQAPLHRGCFQGGRRLFAGHDLEELSVEDLAMRHYFEHEGFECGVHSEGALLRDLFGILLFDELFDTSVDGVFVSEFQDAPLDLGTEVFYTSRQKRLEERLRWLELLPPHKLAAEVNRRFAAVYGTCVRGVNWRRYEGECATLCAKPGPEEVGEVASRTLWTRHDEPLPQEARTLGALAGSVGGTAVAAALRCLCDDYNSAGLPDLILWTWAGGVNPRARFVEVKSERDTLARRQRLWLATLRGAGVEAEVCHVRDDVDAAAAAAAVPKQPGRPDGTSLLEDSDLEFL